MAHNENVADFMMLFLAITYMAAVKDLFYGGMMCVCLGAFVHLEAAAVESALCVWL